MNNLFSVQSLFCSNKVKVTRLGSNNSNQWCKQSFFSETDVKPLVDTQPLSLKTKDYEFSKMTSNKNELSQITSSDSKPVEVSSDLQQFKQKLKIPKLHLSQIKSDDVDTPKSSEIPDYYTDRIVSGNIKSDKSSLRSSLARQLVEPQIETPSLYVERKEAQI